MQHPTLQPSGQNLLTGTVVGGANVQTVLGDNDSSTYVLMDVENEEVRVLFDDYTIPANKRVIGARLYINQRLDRCMRRAAFGRSTAVTYSANYQWRQEIYNDEGLAEGSTVSSTIPGSSGPDGSFSEANINALSAYFQGAFITSGTDTLRIRRAYVILDLLQRPMQSLTNPVPGLTNVSTGPLVQWTWIGDGEAQYKYELKIFTEAVAEGGGFNPETSTAVYSAAPTTSSATVHQVPEGTLTPGAVYYVYVRTSKSYYPNTWKSDWSVAEFTVQTAPTVDVTTPSGAVTTTSRPTVTWTYADADGDPQTAFQIKVFNQTQYEAGGFSPATSTPVWDSGVVLGEDASMMVGMGLPNSINYRAYVSVRQLIDETWSAWDYSAFNTNYAQPGAPTVTVTAQPTNARMKVDVDSTGGLFDPDDSGFTIQRRSTGDWETILSDYVVTTEPFTIYDYSAPFNTPLDYRALEWNDSTGLIIEGPWGEDLDTTLVVPYVWLKDPEDWADGLSFAVEDTWLSRQRHLPKTVHRPIGRTLPLVVRGENQGESFAMTFVCNGNAIYTSLIGLLERNHTLLIQTAKTTWYVEVIGLYVTEHLWDELHNEPEGGAWKVQVTFQEVEF